MDKAANTIGQSVVTLNELELDRECVRLPSDLLKYAVRVADLRAEVDQHKASISALEADLSARIRSTPAKFGLEKVTEGAIQATILCDATYKQADAEMREAKHDLELTQAVVTALETKKRSLTLLVELHGMGYFADPKVSAKGKEVLEGITKRNRAKLHQED